MDGQSIPSCLFKASYILNTFSEDVSHCTSGRMYKMFEGTECCNIWVAEFGMTWAEALGQLGAGDEGGGGEKGVGRGT